MTEQELMMRKREVLQTTASRGWQYIQSLAEDTVREMERATFNTDDDAQATVLRRQAKAARQFLTTFISKVEAFKSLDDAEPSEEKGTPDDFYEVSF